jgi:hypothetical protein
MLTRRIQVAWPYNKPLRLHGAARAKPTQHAQHALAVCLLRPLQCALLRRRPDLHLAAHRLPWSHNRDAILFIHTSLAWQCNVFHWQRSFTVPSVPTTGPGSRAPHTACSPGLSPSNRITWSAASRREAAPKSYSKASPSAGTSSSVAPTSPPVQSSEGAPHAAAVQRSAN